MNDNDVDKILAGAEQMIRGVPALPGVPEMMRGITEDVHAKAPGYSKDLIEAMVKREIGAQMSAALRSVGLAEAQKAQAGIEFMRQELERRFGEIEIPKDGKDGKNGKDGKDGKLLKTIERRVGYADYERLKQSDGAGQVTFLPSGTGATAELVQEALRHFVHTAQYTSTANFETARRALTGTLGLETASITHLNNQPSGTLLTENFATEADAVSKDALWLKTKWTGQVTTNAAGAGAIVGPYKLLFTDAAISETCPLTALSIRADWIGNGSTTSNDVLRTGIYINGSVSGRYGAIDDAFSFVGQQIEIDASDDQGGTGGWTPADGTPTDPWYRGALQGGNDLVYLRSGATNYQQVIGREIAVALQTGSSAREMFALHLSKKNTSAVAPDLDEGLLLLAVQDGATGVKNVIQLCKTSNGEWPVQSTGTIFGIVPQEYPTQVLRAARTAAYGIDFREATFSDAAFASNGFAVDDDGVVALTGDLFTSVSDPSAPAASKAILYAKTNGGGKMELAVRFPTGAVQVIATEP